MDLTFSNQNNEWVAEFEVTADFNLHLEGVVEGLVKIFQKTVSDGAYAFVRAGTPYPSYQKVYDYDFVGAIYPKYIKVVCQEEPTLAVVTFNA